MANNLRTLKKDIDFLADDVIADCCTFMYLKPEQEEAVMEIIDEVVELRNTLYNRIYCRQDNPVKPYFRAIRNDLYEGVDQFYEKLSALAKKQA